MLRRTPTSTLFPYTTLFRSLLALSLSRPEPATGEVCSAARAQKISRLAAGDASQSAQATGKITSVIRQAGRDRKSTRLNSSHGYISYAVFCLKKKKRQKTNQ